MRSSLMAALALCVFATPACKKEEKKAPPPVVAEPAPPPPPAPEAPAEPAEPVDDMLNDMKNCPNAVAGADTKVVSTKKAVTVTVTAKDPAATKEIQTRAHALLDAAAPASDEIKHTGTRTGGGALGKCPVVLPGTTAKVDDVKGGVKITLTAVEPQKVEDVGPMVNERLTAMNAMSPPAAEGAASPPGDGAGAGGAPAPVTDGKASTGDPKGLKKAPPGSGAAAPSGEGAAKAAAEDKAETGK
jgi:hypothetical protein